MLNEINDSLTHIHIENSCLHRNNLTFFAVFFDQINAALLAEETSFKDVFERQQFCSE